MPVNTDGTVGRATAAAAAGPRRARRGRPRARSCSSSCGASASAVTPSGPSSGRPSPPISFGREEQRERVDETCVEQRGRELGAALDQQRGHLARAEQLRAPRASEAAASGLDPGGRRRRSGGRDAHDRRARRASAPACCRRRGGRGGRTRRAAAGARPAARRRAAGARDRRRAPSRCRRRPRRTPPARRARARRLSGEEIQRLSPVLVAMRPSSVAASLSSTNGRPRTTCVRKAAFCRRARASSAPAGELDLRRRRRAAAPGRGRRPRDWDRRWRRRRARCPPPCSASAQGGWRPWWLQGSSETYAVAPTTGSLQASSALRSACGSPRRTCQPSPSTRPSRAITQPTSGFGLALRRPRSARSSARVEQLRVALVHASATSAVSACQASPGDGWP